MFRGEAPSVCVARGGWDSTVGEEEPEPELLEFELPESALRAEVLDGSDVVDDSTAVGFCDPDVAVGESVAGGWVNGQREVASSHKSVVAIGQEKPGGQHTPLLQILSLGGVQAFPQVGKLPL